MQQFISTINIQISKYDPFDPFIRMNGVKWVHFANKKNVYLRHSHDFYNHHAVPNNKKKSRKPSLGFHNFLPAMGEWVKNERQ